MSLNCLVIFAVHFKLSSSKYFSYYCPADIAPAPQEEPKENAVASPEEEALPTKEEIVQSIEKVDMEIAKTEAEIAELLSIIVYKVHTLYTRLNCCL